MKSKVILVVLLLLAITAGAFGQAMTNTIKRRPTSMWWRGDYRRDRAQLWAREVEDRIAGVTSGFDSVYFEPTTQPTSTEGRMYYNDAANLWYGYNGTTWSAFDLSGGVSLDGAYDNGNAITVDGNPVALTVGATDNNSALTIAHGETTNNNDAFSIAHSGSGDAIEITIADTDGVAARFIAAASQTTSLGVYDASTSNWDGADNIGLLHLQADDPLIHAGASLLGIHNSGQPITAAEGFLARFVSTGTARTNAYAMEIEVPATQPALLSNGIVVLSGQDAAGAALLQVIAVGASGDADAMTITNTGAGDNLQITVGEADGVGARLIAAASQTTSLAVFDAATSNWDGADNVGLVHLTTDDPYIHAGASALMVADSSTPISAAEGFLARFVHSGTARTNSSAVEIEVPATQPALAVNGIVAVTGQDNPGAALVQVTGIDTTSNTDTVTVDHSGSGNALYLDLNEADSQGLTIEPFTNSTVAALEIDGDAAGWDGADDVGMVHLRNDDPGIHAGATLLLVDDSSQPITAAEGFLARFVATGAARTNSSAVEIEVPATQPALATNGIVAISGQDAAGAALVQIANVAASGNADGVTISSTGSGDALQITVGEADGVAQRNIAAASQTTSLAVFDAATSNWDGADNIGMVHIVADDPVVHTGASLFQVIQSGQPIAASEGHLARFVSSGTARTDAYAVEIETTNTTPALMVNNQVTISGADSAGTLFDITSLDASGNSDTMTINHTGTGDALSITVTDADGVGTNLVAATSQTTSVLKVDGATGSWLGADDVGMIHVTNDGALAHVDSSLLRIANSGVPQNDSRGSSLRIVDTGNAAAGTAGYAVYISATDATVEALYVDDGDVLIDDALQVGGLTTVDGINQPVVVVTDAATYSVLAANTGKIHVIGDLSQNTAINLPTEAAGLYYKFIYCAAAVEAHDHVIDSEANANFYIGGVAFIDSDAGDGADELHAGLYSDGNSNSELDLNNIATGTWIEMYCDGTNWYLTGLVLSDTVPAITDQ